MKSVLPLHETKRKTLRFHDRPLLSKFVFWSTVSHFHVNVNSNSLKQNGSRRGGGGWGGDSRNREHSQTWARPLIDLFGVAPSKCNVSSPCNLSWVKKRKFCPKAIRLNAQLSEKCLSLVYLFYTWSLKNACKHRRKGQYSGRNIHDTAFVFFKRLSTIFFLSSQGKSACCKRTSKWLSEKASMVKSCSMDAWQGPACCSPLKSNSRLSWERRTQRKQNITSQAFSLNQTPCPILLLGRNSTFCRMMRSPIQIWLFITAWKLYTALSFHSVSSWRFWEQMVGDNKVQKFHKHAFNWRAFCQPEQSILQDSLLSFQNAFINTRIWWLWLHGRCTTLLNIHLSSNDEEHLLTFVFLFYGSSESFSTLPSTWRGYWDPGTVFH